MTKKNFVSEKLAFTGDVFEFFQALPKKGPSVLLESARVNAKTGRYSFIGCNPSFIFSSETYPKKNPFKFLQTLLDKREIRREGIPPFLGGAIGFISYNAKSWIEPKLKRLKKDDLRLPDLYFLFFDEGFAVDHLEKTITLYSWKEKAALSRLLERFQKTLPLSKPSEFKPAKNESEIRAGSKKSDFLRQVIRAKNFIREGDIYQANLSQRFDFKCPMSPLDMYANLRKTNPGSFFAYLDALDFQIVCGSPERLLRLQDGFLDTRPIAGTRPRSVDEKKDKEIQKELMVSPKERAEHIMLVDLERNDLGRVCEYGSVHVDELLAVEDYSHVKHIVSNVKGRLREDREALDAIQAFFPGGTITGAPKVRSMEIIEALEPQARGPYTGSIGYLSFTGNMDFNIIIRSLIIRNGRAYLQVGAGIVADSVPQKEYEETLYKAKGVFSSLFGEEEARKILRRFGIKH